MRHIRKITNIVPSEWRILAGDTEVEWVIDGEKINCGTAIEIFSNGKKIEGRFEMGENGPYLAPRGVKIHDGMPGEFLKR